VRRWITPGISLTIVRCVRSALDVQGRDLGGLTWIVHAGDLEVRLEWEQLACRGKRKTRVSRNSQDGLACETAS
jgi:hypothetical protein